MSTDAVSSYLARPLPALHRLSPPTTLQPQARTLEVRWASCEEDVRQAQRLRYRVFAQEMGARLTPPPGTAPGLDVDAFDSFCDHLLVSAQTGHASEHEHEHEHEHGQGQGQRQGQTQLVGTYRVLAPAAARRAGGLYIDTEFDLEPLSSLRGRAVELGRSCVHPDWRSGGVIMALWTALCQYMLAHQLDTMIGCASVGLGGLGDHGRSVNRLWRRLRHSHMAAPQWQVQPHTPLPMIADDLALGDQLAHQVDGLDDTPALIKGYLRCGARLLGPPALDAAFNTADLPMMLRVEELAPRYRKHFMGAPTSGRLSR